MKRHVMTAFTALVLMAGCSKGPVGNSHVPQPVKTVDVEKYLGTWYEIARYENRFERGCEAVTATYAALPDNRIKVVNQCRRGGVDGKPDSAIGKAKIVPDSGNAKLKVSFFGPFYVGNYWVLDRADDYSWSIVGEPSGTYLWLLTRDAKPSQKLVDQLYDRAAQLGYNVEMLRKVKH